MASFSTGTIVRIVAENIVAEVLCKMFGNYIVIMSFEKYKSFSKFIPSYTQNYEIIFLESFKKINLKCFNY